jgi:hypothetical protein
VLEVAAVAAVERVEVRFALANRPGSPKEQVELQKGAKDEQGRTRWATSNVRVPTGPILRFKLYYTVAGRQYKDDNSSHYYLAPPPKPPAPPPPPEGRGKAAAEWNCGLAKHLYSVAQSGDFRTRDGDR